MAGTLGTRLTASLLVLLMAIGSVFLWLGIPFGWIYLASQMVKSSQPTLGPYVMVLLGIPVTMVIVGKALSKLNRLYGEVTGTTPDIIVRAPWLRSMRGEREERHPRTILDVVMVLSVGLALLCLGVWFFFFAQGGGI
jgi:hypothetical protein